MRELNRLRNLVPPHTAPRFDAQRAEQLLLNLPALLTQATPEEQRMHLRALFERVWLKNRTVYAVTRRPDMYPMLQALGQWTMTGC